MDSIYYELGVTLGKSLSVELPPFKSWISIALPEKQTCNENENEEEKDTGHLYSLKGFFYNNSVSTRSEKKLNEAIIDACNLLLKEENKPQGLFSKDFLGTKSKHFKELKEKAENRLKILNNLN